MEALESQQNSAEGILLEYFALQSKEDLEALLANPDEFIHTQIVEAKNEERSHVFETIQNQVIIDAAQKALEAKK